MGEQRNLTPENVDELKEHLDRMKQDNPDLVYRFFNQDKEDTGDAEDTITIVKEIRAKIEDLERKIDLIFDGNVLINGKFTKLS